MPSKLFKLLRAGDIADEHIDDFEAILFSHFQSAQYPPGRARWG